MAVARISLELLIDYWGAINKIELFPDGKFTIVTEIHLFYPVERKVSKHVFSNLARKLMDKIFSRIKGYFP